MGMVECHYLQVVTVQNMSTLRRLKPCGLLTPRVTGGSSSTLLGLCLPHTWHGAWHFSMGVLSCLPMTQPCRWAWRCMSWICRNGTGACCPAMALRLPAGTDSLLLFFRCKHCMNRSYNLLNLENIAWLQHSMPLVTWPHSRFLSSTHRCICPLLQNIGISQLLDLHGQLCLAA